MPEKCPVCLAGEIQPLSAEQWNFDGVAYRLALCKSCGSVHTAPLPGDALLEKLYRTSFDYRWYQDHYRAKLMDCRTRVQELGPLLGQRVLDFGGGMGYFSRAASEVERESTTYDPYVPSSIPAENSWDCVITLHALEHANDLDRIIGQIKDFLVPGGKIIVAVPNFASLGYQRLGMQWVWAQPPLIHIFHFTAAGLSALLTRHGFEGIAVSYHERWDANLYCDVTHFRYYRAWDAAWRLRPFTFFAPYRKLIARINSQRRFRGLARSMKDFDPSSDIHPELQVVATQKHR